MKNCSAAHGCWKQRLPCLRRRDFGRDHLAIRRIAVAHATVTFSHKILILVLNSSMHPSENGNVIACLGLAPVVPVPVVLISVVQGMADAALVGRALAVQVQVVQGLGLAEESLICRFPSRCDSLVGPATRSLILRCLGFGVSGWRATLTRFRFRRRCLQEIMAFETSALDAKWCFVAPAVG